MQMALRIILADRARRGKKQSTMEMRARCWYERLVSTNCRNFKYFLQTYTRKATLFYVRISHRVELWSWGFLPLPLWFSLSRSLARSSDLLHDFDAIFLYVSVKCDIIII